MPHLRIPAHDPRPENLNGNYFTNFVHAYLGNRG